MTRQWIAGVLLCVAGGLTTTGRAAATVPVLSVAGVAQVDFAVQELSDALQARNYVVQTAGLEALAERSTGTRIVVARRSDATATLALKRAGAALPPEAGAEGFSIRRSERGGAVTLWVVGTDAAGAMYGGLELAEIVRCQGLDAVADADQTPYMALRGIKYNCPLDERTPTYHAHTGDSQRNNVAVMWDFAFWQAYLDDMARFRYNYLSLWNLHPFPSLVRVPGYEQVALDDVETTTGTIRMSLDEKIAFWRRVMRYARERNVDVYIVTWNIFVKGTDGQYGLTDKADNAVTQDYFRKSVKQLFLTYPDLAGIGITAGENMPKLSSAQKEAWVFETYGRGVLDAAAAQPGRKITFIHRQHQTGAQQIAKTFQALVAHPDIDFIFSFKYAKAHCFSSTRQPFGDDFVEDIGDLKTIWTLRNDSNYYFRWGGPNFVREFLQQIPYEVSRGWYYGSDGWVWGRDFLALDPQDRGQLDMDKHWYHWLLWGRLGYNPDLDNARLTRILGARFPEVSADDLFTAWQEASMVYPVTTGFHWGSLDFQWYIEGCCSRPGYAHTKSGFHDVERFISLGVHPGTDNVAIPDYVREVAAGRRLTGTTPPEVAQRLHGQADRALALLDGFPAVTDDELARTLDDIRAMALLGKYYGHKIQGSTEVALARATHQARHREAALSELTQAAAYWQRYVDLAMSRYVNPVELNRVGVIDWRALTEEVWKDVAIARDLP